MPHIDILIQGRSYSVQCQKGEEKRAHLLAAHINRHAARLVARLGNMPDAQLLLMTGMTVADELLETQEKLMRLKKGEAADGGDDNDDVLAERIEATSKRLENIAEILEPSDSDNQSREEGEANGSGQSG